MVESFFQMWAENIDDESASLSAAVGAFMVNHEPVQPPGVKVSSTLMAGDGTKFTESDWRTVNAVSQVLMDATDPLGTPCALAARLAKSEFWPARHALNYLVAAGVASRTGTGAFLRWHYISD